MRERNQIQAHLHLYEFEKQAKIIGGNGSQNHGDPQGWVGSALRRSRSGPSEVLEMFCVFTRAVVMCVYTHGHLGFTDFIVHMFSLN